MAVGCIVAAACASGSPSAVTPPDSTSPPGAAPPDTAPAGMLSIDCTADNVKCPALAIAADAPDNSLFRGYADPSLRRDPVSGRLWLAYSWPHGIVRTSPPSSTQVLDIHVAHSDDSGGSWHYDRAIWTAQPVTSASDGGGGGATYYSSHEVSNIYPLESGGHVTWIGIHKYYTVQEGGNPISDWQHFVSSSMLVLATASDPTGLGAGPTLRIGAAASTDSVDVVLTRLSPELASCAQLSEPALTSAGGRLYLALTCVPQNGPTPLYGMSFYALFSTDASGAPSTWTWKYEGKLTTPAQAQQLDGHQFLWELDFARKSDGALLALVTPSNVIPGGLANDGCRVLQVASLSPPALAPGNTGGFRELATITASDLVPPGGGNACTYDPASTTGIIVFRYAYQQPGTQGVLTTINATGLRP